MYRGKGERYRTPQRCHRQTLGSSARQRPGFFNRHKRKKQRCQEATDEKSSCRKVEASVWIFLPPANPLPPPACLSPPPIKVLVSRLPTSPSRSTGSTWGSLQQRLRSGQFCHTWPHTQGSFSGSFINSHTGLELLATSLHRTSWSLYPNTWTQFSELNCHSVNLEVYHFQSTNT